MKTPEITVVGAGLAGCEAAYQAANQGVSVRLVEMKPHKYTPAHHADGFAELVCSNSLRSNSLANAIGCLLSSEEERRSLTERLVAHNQATGVTAEREMAKFYDLVRKNPEKT
jgi:methylenetetrahydrofolate--tRNA-(uracil-5-)-methyltransferase